MTTVNSSAKTHQMSWGIIKCVYCLLLCCKVHSRVYYVQTFEVFGVLTDTSSHRATYGNLWAFFRINFFRPSVCKISRMSSNLDESALANILLWSGILEMLFICSFVYRWCSSVTTRWWHTKKYCLNCAYSSIEIYNLLLGDWSD